LAGAPTSFSIGTGTQLARAAASAVVGATDGFLAVGWVAAVVVTLVVFDAFALATVQRRRELAVLRAIGARRRHVLGMVVSEALITGVIGVALGTVLGLAVTHEGAMLAQRVVGFRVDERLRVVPLLAAMLGSLTLAVLGAALPAWHAARAPVLDGLGGE
jgi:putative ABC transport system permease protein